MTRIDLGGGSRLLDCGDEFFEAVFRFFTMEGLLGFAAN
jgi:hypothetical protein